MADQVLQDIKDRLNIADVIADYIPIKKAGTNFKALCPFHHEKTPSLQISPQKQIWHCFGCGEGGDIFGFVTRYENVDFKEALKLLAQKAGVTLPSFRPQDPKEQSEKELLFRINDFAARYYFEILVKDKRGVEALRYLKDRGLTLETVKRWQIGFAPDDFHALEQALAKKKVPVADMLKAGVSAKNERGQVYDRFRGRITFPIFDYQAKIAGFSARILKDDGKSAKYVNSPETLIYQKSKILFGLNFAKNAIRKSNEAVVVEGQMDCIAAHQAGFDNVVASSGTALTLEQLSVLARLTDTLKFCFDADAAGQSASQRAGELALKQGFRLKVIVLDKVNPVRSPESLDSGSPNSKSGLTSNGVKDPDELIKKSPGLWEKAVAEAVWFLDWQMDFTAKKFQSDIVEQKHFLNQSVVPLLSYVADPLEQDHYVRQMMERFNISEHTIRGQIRRHLSGQRPASAAAIVPLVKSNALEKEILGGMLKFPEFLGVVLKYAGPEDFEDYEIQQKIRLIFRQGQLAEEDRDSTLAKEAVFMVESLLEMFENQEAVVRRQLDRSLTQLRLLSLKRKQQSLSEEIKAAEIAGNKPQSMELNRQLAEVLAKRSELEKKL